MVTDPVRRGHETAQMIFDSMTPDGLTVGTGPGTRTSAGCGSCTPRCATSSSHGVEHTDDAETARGQGSTPPRVWYAPAGTPLNQEDLLGTLLTFTTVVFEALDHQGIGYQPADAARVPAPVVRRRRAPRDPSRASSRSTSTRPTPCRRSSRSASRSPASTRRSSASHLVGALRDSVRIPGLRGLPATLIRWYCGDPIAKINGIHGSGWTALLFDPLQRLMQLFRGVQRHNKLVRVIIRHLTAAILRNFVDRGRGERPPFTIPDELDTQVHQTERRWRL